MSEMNLEATLKSVFGFDRLRHGQQSVIDNVLSGHSAAAIFPTGSGKSLCYQLPALCLPHLTLVVSPLIALMKDQLAFLHSKGIAAASIESGQVKEETQAVMNAVKQGQIKVLMISVERLKNERFRQFISEVAISLMVVDEAHCISEWGHNFRPDYLKLPQYQRALNIPQVLLLTATATQAVVKDMQDKFAIAPQHVTITGFYRPNLDLCVSPCREENKGEALLNLLAQDPHAPTIVYVTLQHTAEVVAQMLQTAGVKVAAYHAGLEHSVRDAIQRQFMQGELDCIVATIAFGMGVDKADIRRVIHFDLPKSIENYAQEIGRAGRDGLASQCILLANQNGLSVLENFVYGDTPELADIEHVLRQIANAGERWEVMLNRLANEANIRQLPLKTLLVYLELAGQIEAQFAYFADYRFKFIDSANAILQRFSGERRQFVEAIFHCSAQSRVWCQTDFEALWLTYRAERQRIVAALEYFHQQDWIELESKQMTDVYRVFPFQEPLSTLAERLYQLFKDKERSDVARIHQMLDFFQADSCLSYTLASYFADSQAPKHCGHCSVCRGQVAHLPLEMEQTFPNDKAQGWIDELQAQSATPLSAELITRFLCGINTPLLTKLKAKKLTGFAKLESVPYSKVYQQVEQLRKS